MVGLGVPGFIILATPDVGIRSTRVIFPFGVAIRFEAGDPQSHHLPIDLGLFWMGFEGFPGMPPVYVFADKARGARPVLFHRTFQSDEKSFSRSVLDSLAYIELQ